MRFYYNGTINITVLWYHSHPDIWKCSSINEALENHKQGFNNKLIHNLIIRTDISSCLSVLLILRAVTIFNIASSLKQNEESLAVETYCDQLGTVLLLTREVDFEAKKLLQQLALILKSVSSLLLISRAGIIGNFSHYKIILK